MKKLFLILLLIATPVFAQKVDQAKLRKELQDLIKEQGVVLQQVEKDLKLSRETGNTLFAELKNAKLQIEQVGKERDDWKAYGDDRNEKWLNAEKRVAEQKVAKLKWLGAFSGLLILVLLYFGLKFFTPIGKFIP